MRRQNNSAFTLIELLVVIAIIMLLLSILVPALGKVRFVAKEAVCMGKMNSLSKALVGFAHDNHMVFPGGMYGCYQGPDAWQKSFVGTEVSELVGRPFGTEPGTIMPYLSSDTAAERIKYTYRCPLLDEGARGSGEGSNGVFDYAVPSIIYGARMDLMSTTCQNSPAWGERRQMVTPLVVEESPRYYANRNLECSHSSGDRLGTWHGGFDGGGSSNLAGVDGSVRKIGFGTSSKRGQNTDASDSNDVVCGSTARCDWWIPTPSGKTCAIPVCKYGDYNRW